MMDLERNGYSRGREHHYITCWKKWTLVISISITGATTIYEQHKIIEQRHSYLHYEEEQNWETAS